MDSDYRTIGLSAFAKVSAGQVRLPRGYGGMSPDIQAGPSPYSFLPRKGAPLFVQWFIVRRPSSEPDPSPGDHRPKEGLIPNPAAALKVDDVAG